MGIKGEVLRAAMATRDGMRIEVGEAGHEGREWLEAIYRCRSCVTAPPCGEPQSKDGTSRVGVGSESLASRLRDLPLESPFQICPNPGFMK